MPTVYVATLGQRPEAISVAFDLLNERFHYDALAVLHTAGIADACADLRDVCDRDYAGLPARFDEIVQADGAPIHDIGDQQTAEAYYRGVLHNDVLPFYADHNLTVQAVLTDNGRGFCGTDTHPYELYLALNDIEHRRTRVRTPRTNGFVERFQRTVLEEFFVQTLRTTFYETVEALQADLDTWLRFYNIERPHQGYRNMGRRPYGTVQLYLQSVTIEG